MKTCEICHKVFSPYRKTQKFCSYECNRKAHNEKQRKEYVHHKSETIKECLICHKYFIKSSNNQKYCKPCKIELERTSHIKRQNKYQNKRRKIDNNFKLKCYLRNRINAAIKGKNKSLKTLELLGCSVDELWNYLESKFQPGMTRENYGKWHIDHIKPCARFDFNDPKQQLECFHYTNLQPLWAIDNIKKSDNIV